MPKSLAVTSKQHKTPCGGKEGLQAYATVRRRSLPRCVCSRCVSTVPTRAGSLKGSIVHLAWPNHAPQFGCSETLALDIVSRVEHVGLLRTVDKLLLRQNICGFVAAIRDIDEPARRACGWAHFHVATEDVPVTSPKQTTCTLRVLVRGGLNKTAMDDDSSRNSG